MFWLDDESFIILFEPDPRQYKRSNDVIIFLPYALKNIDLR